MSERYSRLYSQEQSLYAVGSPVSITASALLKDTQTGKVLAQIKFTNICQKKIKALTVSIQPKDTIGNILGTPVEYQYLDLSAERDQSFGQKVPVTLPDSSTRSLDVKVTEVIFADNTIWSGNNEPWEVLPSRITIEETITDPQLRTQFRLEYGQGCRYWYQTHKDLWYCTCGTLNHEKEHGCHKCGQTVSKLASLNMSELEQRKNERLVHEKAAMEKKAAEQAETQKKNMALAKKAGIIAAVLALVVMVGAFAANSMIIKQITEQAMQNITDLGSVSVTLPVYGTSVSEQASPIDCKYNENGQVIEKTYASDYEYSRATYEYDESGLVERVTSYYTKYPGMINVFEYEYDSNGREVSAIEKNVASDGRLISKEGSFNTYDGNGFKVGYEYKQFNNKDEAVVDSG